jgi:hypothetical protein
MGGASSNAENQILFPHDARGLYSAFPVTSAHDAGRFQSGIAEPAARAELNRFTHGCSRPLMGWQLEEKSLFLSK